MQAGRRGRANYLFSQQTSYACEIVYAIDMLDSSFDMQASAI